MCGIAGYAGPGSARMHDAVVGMLKTLRHRGPDNWHCMDFPGAVLGHARLSIVDLSEAGNQPIGNETRTVYATVNGEIYNAPELRDGLINCGHRFSSGSDSEVVLHLYEEFGLDFLPKLNGMFAFALYDCARERLLLVRDRLGIKPLYYHQRGGELFFASEIKALDTVCPSITFDPEGLAQTLAYGNQFGARTLTEGYKIVKPGEYIVWESGKLTSRDFFTLEIKEDSGIDFPTACCLFSDTLRASVKRHLLSDVPVASYLSSGFDSTMVAATAAGLLTSPISTYTGVFGSSGWYDESLGAGETARKIHSDHHVVKIDGYQLPQVLEDTVTALDEPRMGFGALSQAMVARSVSERQRVILTGHGGDELFAGYPQYKLALLSSSPFAEKCRMIPHFRKSEIPHLVYFAGRKLLSPGTCLPLPTIISASQCRSMLRPEVSAVLDGISPAAEGLATMGGSGDNYYHTLLRSYLKLYLPGLFVVEDRISMACSLESRTPLCDNEMLELALKIPLKVKLQNGILKHIPKQSMKGILPELLWKLPKRGFPTPFAQWLRGPSRDWLVRRLGKDSPLNTVFQPEKLSQLTDAYLNGWSRGIRPLDEIPSHRMWLLLSLDTVMRKRGIVWK